MIRIIYKIDKINILEFYYFNRNTNKDLIMAQISYYSEQYNSRIKTNHI